MRDTVDGFEYGYFWETFSDTSLLLLVRYCMKITFFAQQMACCQKIEFVAKMAFLGNKIAFWSKAIF
jgi:hypothetical protein